MFVRRRFAGPPLFSRKSRTPELNITDIIGRWRLLTPRRFQWFSRMRAGGQKSEKSVWSAVSDFDLVKDTNRSKLLIAAVNEFVARHRLE